ncbi:MAG: hypothetical protein IJA85_08905 [Clostridia bacterium]|nr:hypothetical protein [Clostridia bacterium]
MSNLELYDSNFAANPYPSLPKLIFRDCRETPFSLHGLLCPSEERPYFHRLPLNVAKAASDAVVYLSSHTAGGRVRFRTDSPYIAIRALLHNIEKANHFSITGSAGFDLYRDSIFLDSYRPSPAIADQYDGVLMTDGKMHDYMIHFPLYSGCKALLIGLDEAAALEAPTSYAIEKPVLYYGSSITQGGCASRAGMAYQNIISRRLDCDQINLGFSGSAKAEMAVANYIIKQDISAFVYDYDHNAPNPDYLEQTHESFYLRIREACPTLPVLMVTRPDHIGTEDTLRRRDIIKSTYEKALSRGEPVYFLDSSEFTAEFGGDHTVDTTHPTDLGFWVMANAIGAELAKILK